MNGLLDCCPILHEEVFNETSKLSASRMTRFLTKFIQLWTDKFLPKTHPILGPAGFFENLRSDGLAYEQLSCSELTGFRA